MKNHLIFKFIAIVVCACALLGGIISVTGAVSFISIGMYSHSLEELQNQQVLDNLERLANEVAVRYAAEGKTSEKLVDAWCEREYNAERPDDELWYYVLRDENGMILKNKEGTQNTSGALKYEFHVDVRYPIVQAVQEQPGVFPELPNDPLFPEPTDPVLPTEAFSYYDDVALKEQYYMLELHDAPLYLVQVYVMPGAYEQEMAFLWELQAWAFDHKYDLFLPMLICLLVFAATGTYLCSVSGKKPGREELSPGGLNRMPLDVYLVIASGVTAALVSFYIEWIRTQLAENTIRIQVLTILLTGYVACLLIVGFFYALAAQIQLPDGYWWRHSALYKLYLLARKLLDMLPMVWKWVVMGSVLVLLITLAAMTRIWWLMVPALVIAAGVFLWAMHSYKLLLDGAKRMSRGDLNSKVDGSKLAVGFSEFAVELNALADVAVVAAQKQMKSERMRAELITNVSHDIRTPLTSIINYVDLLKSAGSPEEAQAYLEVLSRQSDRMKKLIDDLIELSKASTGNMPVHIQTVDAVEYMNQAIGEFSDKLDRADLAPVFAAPQEPVMMCCDSRLTWRVLSNLMSNAVKYALPGTRLYVDVTRLEGNVLISLKNISRQQLNVDPEELMERFVRGDAARNTEGSGLGLNIAKSLMELQKGQLKLTVDGDLFKATLLFPGADTVEEA